MCEEICPDNLPCNDSNCEASKEVTTKTDVEVKFSCAMRVYHRAVYCIRTWNVDTDVGTCIDKEVSFRLLNGNE